MLPTLPCVDHKPFCIYGLRPTLCACADLSSTLAYLPFVHNATSTEDSKGSAYFHRRFNRICLGVVRDCNNTHDNGYLPLENRRRVISPMQKRWFCCPTTARFPSTSPNLQISPKSTKTTNLPKKKAGGRRSSPEGESIRRPTL